MPRSWPDLDPAWTMPLLSDWDIPELTSWSTLDPSTWNVPEPATWPILEPTTWDSQQPITRSPSIPLPEFTVRAAADQAPWTIPDPLTMLPRFQAQATLLEQQAVGAPDAFVCGVDGCGKSSHLLEGLNAHIRESHQGQLFCPQPGCPDRRIWPDVVNLYVHAKRAHLNDDRYWCHICYYSGPAPEEIQLHVDANHWHYDAAFEVRRIEAEWRRRRFPL